MKRCRTCAPGCRSIRHTSTRPGGRSIPGAGAGGARALLCEALPPAQRRRGAVHHPERGAGGAGAGGGAAAACQPFQEESRRLRRLETLPAWCSTSLSLAWGGLQRWEARPPRRHRGWRTIPAGAAAGAPPARCGRARRAARTPRVLGARPHPPGAAALLTGNDRQAEASLSDADLSLPPGTKAAGAGGGGARFSARTRGRRTRAGHAGDAPEWLELRARLPPPGLL